MKALLHTVAQWIRQLIALLARITVGTYDVKELAEQFMITVRASFDQALVHNPNPPHELVERVRFLIKYGPISFRTAYEIERLLVEIYDDASISTTLKRRLGEAKSQLDKDSYDSYEALVNDVLAKNDVAQQRTILHRMINDLQWSYTKQQVTRVYQRDIRRNTVLLFLIALLMFVGLILWAGAHPDFEDLNLLVAVMTGFMGACWSTLVNVEERFKYVTIDDLASLRTFAILLFRPTVGLGAGIIMYYLLNGGLLGGSFFPDLTPSRLSRSQINQVIEYVADSQSVPGSPLRRDSVKNHLRLMFGELNDSKMLEGDRLIKGFDAFMERDTALSLRKDFNRERLQSKIVSTMSTVKPSWVLLGAKDFALLVVWCFLAGFSEKFVPNLLAKAEESVSVKKQT
ncbi:MAG: hypothetical protein HY033_07070 [Ignavibacteriae bacterium]|nr:hypothetical protein [Ignavibacteria bacterium]MBI3364654.1 hypothetical protein [Ignavibacteriota bacterium]